MLLQKNVFGRRAALLGDILEVSMALNDVASAAYFVGYDSLRSFDYQGSAGVTFRPVVTPTTMLNFVHFEPDSEVPRHRHVEEQIVYVIEGQLDFELDGVRKLLGPGDLVVIPPMVWHGARTHGQSCLEVDVFNPPRRALLDAVGGAGQFALPGA
jgi:quercetin dioxygenase-like cupin family protein